MKKLLTILFAVISMAAFAQSGSINVGAIRSRVVDSTTVVYPSGNGVIYFNAQSGKWRICDPGGVNCRNIGGGSGGGGGTQDLNDVLSQGGGGGNLIENTTITGNGFDLILTTSDVSVYSTVTQSPGNLILLSSNNANTEQALINVNSSTGITVDDTSPAGRGIQGGDNYSANILANDYTQKNYVDQFGTTRNRLEPSIETISFTLSLADTSKMIILDNVADLVITLDDFSAFNHGTQWAFYRKSGTDTVYFDAGGEILEALSLGITEGSYAYLYYNFTDNEFYLSSGGGGGGGGGSGTVTSVAQSFTGGLISVAGSPVTTTGTLALTVAGTSGGIPYFSSSSTWASSGALAANAIVIGGGAGSAPSTTTTGTGVLTALGNNIGSSGAPVVFNGAGGTPSSLTLTNATGLPVAGGGTGASTLTGILQGNGTSAVTTITNSTTVGQVLRVTGSNTYGFGAVDLADGDAITGILPIANGGSGTSTGAWAVGGNTLGSDAVLGGSSGAFGVNLQTNGVTRYSLSSTGLHALTQSAQAATNTFITATQADHTSGVPLGFSYVGGTLTGSTASTEHTDWTINLGATLTKATGDYATNRSIRIIPRVISAGAASIITNAITMEIGAPTVAGSATFTNAHSIRSTNGWITAQQTATSTQGFQLIQSANTAQWTFQGGNVMRLTSTSPMNIGPTSAGVFTLSSARSIAYMSDLNQVSISNAWTSSNTVSTANKTFADFTATWTTVPAGDNKLMHFTPVFVETGAVASNYYAVDVDGTLNFGATPTGNYYGLRIHPTITGGTLNSILGYGVVVDSPLLKNGWGTSTPTEVMHVVGNALITGNTTLSTAGSGFLIKEGSNATMGVATLSAGTVTVNTTKVTANSRIILTVQSLGTVSVATPVAVTARTASTSFTITSASASDTSVIAWVIFEPAP